MGKAIYFRQCRLIKTTEVGTKHQTSWLPEQFAHVGQIVKLRDDSGTWENGWRVEQTSQTKVLEDALFDVHQGVKSHRKATGDSMKK